MTPLVLMNQDRRFAGAIGSAGGNAILAYVGKSLVAAVDWRVPMQEALALPNLVARGANFYGEVSKFPEDVLAGLTARGITLKSGQGEDSGVQAVIVRDGDVVSERAGRTLALDPPTDGAMARRADAYLQERFGSGLNGFAGPEAAFAGPTFQVEPCRA